MIAGTANGPQIVANTAKAMVLSSWTTVCDTAWLKAMGAPGLPTPVAGNIFTSHRALFTAETQPSIGLTVIRTDAKVTDALGAMDQSHELEIAVTSDWGYYDGSGVHPLVVAGPGDPAIPFTVEVYETALRAYVEGIIMILTSPVYGFPNYDARNAGVLGFTPTGIFNSSPAAGISPADFVVGTDGAGQSLIQQTVRATIRVDQRRNLVR
jgi:hypothetical protein